ncbi:MAG TPA: PAS domain S-box protein [Mesorhizobium sp.]|nr:PAS domain S-box protein [Mesorhizobium sp.]
MNAEPRRSPWPALSGEMAERIREHDWASTVLGPIAQWPQSLKTALGIMLASPDPVSVVWGPERIQLYNDAYIVIAGERHPAILGGRIAENWAEVHAGFLQRILDGVLADGRPRVEEDHPVRLHRPGGEEERFFTFSFSAIPDEAGAVAGVFLRVAETTAKRAAQAALRATEERDRRLIEGVKDHSILTTDVTGTIVGWTPGSERVFGWTAEEAIGRKVDFLFTPEDRAGGVPEKELATAREKGCANDERWHVRKDGSRFFVNGSARPLHDAQGEVSGFIKIGRDETRRRAAEISLAKQSEQLQALAQAALTVTRAPTLEATLDEITQAAKRIIGAHQAVVSLTRGPDWSQAINTVAFTDRYARWRDYAAVPDGSGIYAWACEDNRPARMTQAELEAHPRWRGFGLHAKDHPPMRGWLAAPLVGRDGRNLGLIQLSDKVDGTEFDEADEAMLVQLAQLASAAVEQSLTEHTVAQREAHLAAIFEQSAAGLSETDSAGCFIRVNDRFCAITGRTREELLTLRMHDITHKDDLPRNEPHFDEAVASGKPFEIEKRYIRPDGSTVWVLNSVTALRDADGRPQNVVCVTVDVSERKRWEEHQRLLVNELNHRVKNSLATVQSIASQTLRNARSADEARGALESRIQAMVRAHDVLTRENWESADLWEIVAEAVAPFSNAREDRLHLRGPSARVSPRMALALSMALQELSTNAAKYGALSNEAGQIAIAWSIDRQAPPRLRLTWQERGGPPVATPARRGFGSRLIERGLAQELDGEVTISFPPEGVICTVKAPLA